MVKTEVVRKNDTVNVDYKLIESPREWQVYDIVVEGGQFDQKLPVPVRQDYTQ